MKNDLISRQAAIDAIRGWVNKAFDDWGNAEDEIRCFNAIYPLIKALPSAQPEQQWIPCKTRLPEEYGEYRITWITSAAPGKRFIGDAEFEVSSVWDNEHNRFEGEWLLDDYIENYPDVEVLAWKPIGEPWKGEQE